MSTLGRLTAAVPEKNECHGCGQGNVPDDILRNDPLLAQDIADGEALRLLREAVDTGFFLSYDRLFANVPPVWRVRVPFGGQQAEAPTIAEAADACRVALEVKP